MCSSTTAALSTGTSATRTSAGSRAAWPWTINHCMNTSRPSPTPSSAGKPGTRWLLGGGAILTLLGGLLAEGSLLLLFAGASVAWLGSILLAGLLSVLVGVALLLLGRHLR